MGCFLLEFMKRIILFYVALLMSVSVFAQKSKEPGIHFFQGSWSELLAEAKKAKKGFFVDFFAVWCGPCKMMSSTTFKDEDVGNFVSKNMLAYKLDAEKGEGPGLQNKYRVRAYPTVVFFDSEGNEIGREIGMLDKTGFLQVLEKYLPNMKPKGKSSSRLEDYQRLKEKVAPVIEDKIGMNPATKSAKLKAAEYGKFWNEVDFDALMAESQKQLPPNQLWILEATYYGNSRQYEKLTEIINPLFESEKLSADQLHWSVLFYMNSDQISPITMRWINQAIRMEPDPEKYDTKAFLLFQNQRYEDAAEAIKESLKLAKKESISRESSEILNALITAKL